MGYARKSLKRGLPFIVFWALPAFAAVNDSSQQIDLTLQAKLTSLQQQVTQLQQTLVALKQQPIVRQQKKPVHRVMLAKHQPNTRNIIDATPSGAASSKPLMGDPDVPGNAYVSTGPYMGVPLTYSGSHLIINSPKINEDVALLKIRQSIAQRLQSSGLAAYEDHTHLLLSGTVEGEAIVRRPSTGPVNTDIDVTDAEIDSYILGPTRETSALLSLSYDNNLGVQNGSLNNNSRTKNSRLYVNQAFIILGDFNKSPFYSSLGQMYVPFGSYNSNMVSSPLTKALARTKARALLFGYYPMVDNTFYASAYVFKGNSAGNTGTRLNNGGLNLGYQFAQQGISGTLGAGWLGNIADADGMQEAGNGASAFGGFGATHGLGREQLVHRVSAMNVRGLVSLNEHITLLAEYVTALQAFSMADMQFNTRGAKPHALNAEAAYTFELASHPASVAVGYGRTSDALALGLPWQRESVTVNTSWWKNTLQSLELRHDINYGASNTASGSTIAVPAATGRADNAITGHFDIYF